MLFRKVRVARSSDAHCIVELNYGFISWFVCDGMFRSCAGLWFGARIELLYTTLECGNYSAVALSEAKNHSMAISIESITRWCRPAFAPFVTSVVSPVGQWSVLASCADQLERSTMPLDLAEKSPVQLFQNLPQLPMIGTSTKTSFGIQVGGSSSTRSSN